MEQPFIYFSTLFFLCPIEQRPIINKMVFLSLINRNEWNSLKERVEK